MTFQPRYFDLILTDMIAHVRANTSITDFTPGSVSRTLLEAAALEDDEQYHQMVQLRSAFRRSTASGSELDERAADYNIERLIANYATTTLVYENESLITSFLELNVSASGSSTLIKLIDSSDFPISGYPYAARIGEGTSENEDVVVTNNNTVNNILTVSSVLFNHSAGERISYVTGSDKEINAGTRIQVPASGDNLPIIFESVEKAFLPAGDYTSTAVKAKSVQNGSANNVSAGQISQFVGSTPFTGAIVRNITNATGGMDREIDDDFRDRITLKLSELMRGTIRAIEGGLKGVRNADSGQQVITAKVVENFTSGEHIVYVDDGTGFVPDKLTMARSFLNMSTPVPIGTSVLTLVNTNTFPNSGHVLISPENPSQTEVIEYTSKGVGNTLNLDTNTTKVHDGTDEIKLVDVLPLAEEGQNFFRFSNYPIIRNSFEIYDNSSGQFELKIFNTDYFLNRTNGELRYFTAGVPKDTQVVANYDYYTGLLAIVQRVINGDKYDPVNYPGLAAGGVIFYADTPIIREIEMIISISVKAGFDEAILKEDARTVTEAYIDGLIMGDNVILAEAVKRIMSIQGITNAKIVYPTNDLIIFENEKTRSYDSNNTSLITVL